MAIKEATDHHKSFVLLSIFSFQALDFYKKNGFYKIGEIKDYPKGMSLYILRYDIK
jgi:ribosomal protein S18 acetylase RimI-like enzyme